jgi:hypothetical protein
MMHKPIDINQRIPLNILYVGLNSFLNGHYSEDYILEQLRLEFKGENRLKKAVRIVSKTILRSPLVDFISENKEQIKQAVKNHQDRNLILISLLNSTFTFSFDVLHACGKFFLVQDLVSRQVIKKSLAKVYGGNRSTDNAIDSVIPMLIEADLINRPMTGVYQRNTDFRIVSTIAKQVFIESFKSAGALNKMEEYQLRDPYFLFVNE